MRVPRWRTRIVPALTVCPANRLTPSRWPLLSRPLRLVPPPFLCAIFLYLFFLTACPFWFVRFHSRFQYSFDTQSGVELTVSVLMAVAYFRLIFKDDYLIAFTVCLSFSQYPGTFNDRITDGYIFAIGDKKYSIQFNGSTFIRTEAFNIQGLTLGNFILLATSLNYSVNFRPPKYTFYQ
jgi:hypothetical protein